MSYFQDNSFFWAEVLKVIATPSISQLTKLLIEKSSVQGVGKHRPLVFFPYYRFCNMLVPLYIVIFALVKFEQLGPELLYYILLRYTSVLPTEIGHTILKHIPVYQLRNFIHSKVCLKCV